MLNYELPHVPEDYIHRIGRTGRAGASGVAISLVDPAEEKYLAEIEKLLKKKVLVHQPEDYSIEKATLAPAERRERGARTGLRTERAPRTERAERAPRGETAARPERQTHEDRMREREEAYARNPDQPVPALRGAATASANGGQSVRSPGAATRPVPMLLQKRLPAPGSLPEIPLGQPAAAASAAAEPATASEDETRSASDAMAPAA